MGQTGKRRQHQRAIVKSLRGGVSRSRACEAAGVGRRTFYHWISDDDAFRRAVEQAEREVIGTVESTALVCALKAEDDPRYQTALIFWLKANAGWKETQVVEHGLYDGAGDTRASILSRIRALAAGGGEGAGAGRVADCDVA